MLCDKKKGNSAEYGVISSTSRGLLMSPVGRPSITRVVSVIGTNADLLNNGEPPVKKTMLSKSRSAARGFSLVEVLVALVVMSIGLLGIAALYVESLRSGTSPLLRSQAVALASDMADRIRANPTAAASYTKRPADDAGTVTAACSPRLDPHLFGRADGSNRHRSVDPTTGRPLSHDLPKGRLGLPGGLSTIAVSAATPRVYTVTVQWTESGQTTPSNYVLRLQL